MTYAAEGDIRRHLGQLAQGWPRADGSHPTVADGLAFAAQASGEIDAILSSQGLGVPVTAPPQFLDHVRDLSAMYAAAFVAAGLFPQAVGPASSTLTALLMTTYTNALAALRRGEGLPLAAVQDPTSLPRAYWTSHPDSNSTDIDGTPGNEIDPVFRRDMKF